MKHFSPLLLLLLIGLFGLPALAETRLTLVEAIRMSQEHSFSIQSCRHDSLSSLYDYRTALASRYPTLSLTGNTYYINKLQTVHFGLQNMEIGSKENYQADMKLSLPLYTGGRISNQIKIQQYNFEAQSFVLEAQKIAVAYQSRKAYLNLLLSHSLVASANASLSRIKLIANDIQNLYQNGMADSVDILDAELAYQKGLRMLAQDESAGRNAVSVLAQLTGLKAGENIVPVDSVPLPMLPDSVYNSDDTSFNSRPELKASESRIRTAGFLVNLKKASYFPNLSGYVGYSAGKPNRDQFNNTWNDYYSVGLSLNWEFNFGGKVGNGANSARHSLFSARMDKSSLAENLNLQVRTTRENLRYAFVAFMISRKELDIAVREYRLAQEKEKVGSMSVNRLLELEADLTATEQAYQASMINYYLYETEYLYSIGAPRIYGGL
jgi:outer membrane protein